MDACKKIRFYSPAQIAGQIAAIAAMYAGIVSALVFLA
jgi:hypothetical protein